MRFLDTSVLVASCWGDHPGHAASIRVLAAATPESASCGIHSLAEVYAVMTRLPVKPAVTPAQAVTLVEQIRRRLAIVSLDDIEYAAAIQRTADLGIGGGRIYDALLVECARKAGADEVLTWNVTDFRRLAPDLAARIRTP